LPCSIDRGLRSRASGVQLGHFVSAATLLIRVRIGRPFAECDVDGGWRDQFGRLEPEHLAPIDRTRRRESEEALEGLPNDVEATVPHLRPPRFEHVMDRLQIILRLRVAIDRDAPLAIIPGEPERHTGVARILDAEGDVRRDDDLFDGSATIPTGAADFWIAEEAWAAVQGNVEAKPLRGKRCYLSLDLSRKNDLTALSADWVTPREGKGPLHDVKTWYWTTKEGLEERAKADQAPYEDWVAEGYLTAVPGSVIDHSFIASKVAELCAEHDVAFLAFDAAFISSFIEACDEIGFPVWKFEGPGKPEGKGLKLVPHAQGTRVMFEEKQLCMPQSITKLEDAILDASIVIDASPVTYSCAANAALIEDGQANRAFDKKRSRGRIDGLVTVTMAVGAAEMNEKPAKPSVYAKRGVIRI
jgi:hypothetical protein